MDHVKRDNYNLYVEDIIIDIPKIDYLLSSLEEAFAMLAEIEEEKRGAFMKKLLAEICFLIATEYKKRGEYEKVRKYAQMSIDLYKESNISTLEDSVPILSELLPDYMHEGVVKSRLLVGEK